MSALDDHWLKNVSAIRHPLSTDKSHDMMLLISGGG